MGKTFSTGLLTNGVWQDSSNNIGIGGAPSGSYKFEVTGTAKISGNVIFSGTLGNGTYTYTLPSATGTLALTSDLSGYVPTSRTLTINGTTYDLSANRSWTITSMIYPGAGIAVSTGTAWGTSITDNSTNWNTAYTNRITSLTITGSSGSATLISNVLNIPTYTLAGLGGQPQLNGTGFVKASGTTISYDNSTYYLASNPSGFITSSGSISGNATTATTAGYATSAGSASSATTAAYLTGRDAYTNGSDGWFRSNGTAGWYNATYAVGIYATDTTWVRTYNNAQLYCSTIIQAGASMRAPIFYDSDDTGYYLDLNSTSNSAMRIRGGALFGPNTTWGAYLRVGSNGNTDTSHASVAATNGNLHMDGATSCHMYLNYYVNGNIYLNGSTYYISSNGSYYNGTASYATTAGGVAWGNVSSKPSNITYWDTWYGSAYLGSNGDLYMGWAGAWTSSWFNQNVKSDAGVTFASIQINGQLQYTGNEYWQGRYKYLWYGYWNQWLDIYGGIGGGSLFYADTLYATYGSVSDMRYKKEVSKLTYGLDELLKMDTIKFKYDLPDKHMSKGDNTYHLGFSAQQLQDLIPELVIEDKNFNMLAITQTELLAVVVNGMKEQQAEIISNKAEIEQLKNIIKQIINK